MSNLLILGAYGRIARIVRRDLLMSQDRIHLTQYLRQANRLTALDPSRELIIEGNVNDYSHLLTVLPKQDMVLADLSGPFEPLADKTVRAMNQCGVKRLIWITGLGLYHEVPGEFGRWVEESCGQEVMEDTRRAAKIIEDSDLDYTIIRAAYMDDQPDKNYLLTEKGQPYQGTTVSRNSIADLIEKIVTDPSLHSRASLGIARPGTEGNRPVWVV